jgi:hypothetical protein
MKESIQQKIERAKRYIRYRHPFEKAAFISLAIIVVLSIFAITSVFPYANSVSIHAGLTVIAEILGVLIGVLLIVIVLMIEQFRQADTILKNAMPKYFELMTAKSQIINLCREEMIEWVTQKEISDIDPEKDENIIRALSNMSTLSIAIDAKNEAIIWNDLLKIGFPEGEIKYIVRNRRLSVTNDAYEFLNLLKIIFNSINALIMTNGKTEEIRNEVLSGFSKEGIFDVLDRFRLSESFLRSPSLAISFSFTTIILVIAIFTIFGVSDIAINEGIIMILVNLIVVGFLLSLILTAFSVRKIFSLGQ